MTQAVIINRIDTCAIFILSATGLSAKHEILKYKHFKHVGNVIGWFNSDDRDWRDHGLTPTPCKLRLAWINVFHGKFLCLLICASSINYSYVVLKKKKRWKISHHMSSLLIVLPVGQCDRCLTEDTVKYILNL